MEYEASINSIYYLTHSMTFESQIPTKTLRDLLTQEEITNLQGLRGYPLIAVCKREDNTKFCGYYPLNAGIDDNLIPHRVDNELDILKDFCTGG